MSQTQFEERFTVSAPATLRVKNIRGDVQIEPHDEESIHILAVRDDESGNAERTRVTLRQDANGDVLAETEYEEPFLGISRPCRVAYTIRAPRATHLRLRQVSGNTSAKGFSGNLKLKSVSGAVQLDDMAGDIILRSVSGRVEARSLRGTLELDTVSGRGSILESDLSQVQASSVSGKLTVQTALADGPYRFSSVSGGLQLILAGEQQGCRVHGSTISGGFRTDLTATRGSHSQRHWDLEFNGGGPEVRLKSVSGHIRVLSHAEAQAGPVVFGRAEAPDRMDILEKVRAGELSVDEALRKLG